MYINRWFKCHIADQFQHDDVTLIIIKYSSEEKIKNMKRYNDLFNFKTQFYFITITKAFPQLYSQDVKGITP